MEHIKELEIRTRNYYFAIKLFQKDLPSKESVAELSGFTPPLAQETQPGEPIPYMQPIPEERYRGTDKATLIEQCKTRIKELDGEILTEREV